MNTSLITNAGIWLAIFSGVANGLFTTPLKKEGVWKWENTWFVFIVVACLVIPAIAVLITVGDLDWLSASPRSAVVFALLFGFVWGFGAIAFGRSVDRLGVSVSNSLVIGTSSALGSFLPLLIGRNLRLDAPHYLLYAGVCMFLAGVSLCGRAGKEREQGIVMGRKTNAGYTYALAAGVISAIFNVGYSLSLPITETGVTLHQTRFAATNCIWLLMLGAGAIPNLAYCVVLMRNRRTGQLLIHSSLRSWTNASMMGILWAGSILLYGAATPLLGSLGPSVGWPLSLAVGLLVANLMGLALGEWKDAPGIARRHMGWGIATILFAIALCAISAWARL